MRPLFLAKTMVCSLAVFLCGAAAASATGVIPLSFDEIAGRAGAIALVETVRVRSDWRTSPQGKHIVTVVTFKVERTIKGQVGQQLEVEFLGGAIGGLVMDVDGMPQFRAGDRDVLFLSPNRNSVAPIVGLFQGRFRVERDRAAGTERILTHSGAPFLPASAGIRTLLSAPLRSPGRSLSYSQFESLVVQTLAQSTPATR